MGDGSMGPGSGMQEPVYNVPWRVRTPEFAPVTEGLVLYWFPSWVQEVQKSQSAYLQGSLTLCQSVRCDGDR